MLHFFFKNFILYSNDYPTLSDLDALTHCEKHTDSSKNKLTTFVCALPYESLMAATYGPWNMRLLPLRLVETAIWRLFLRAATGLDWQDEIQKFVDAISKVESLDPDTLRSDYFFKSEHHILTHLGHILSDFLPLYPL
jgi:hypothetical protein